MTPTPIRWSEVPRSELVGLGDQLLTRAESKGAAVTVFAVGTWLEQHPAGIDAEVSRCAAILRRQTGSVGAAFRPSGGPMITPPMVACAQRAGYAVVLGYDVDPSDYADPGSDAVTARVLSAVRAGSVVSLQLGHRGTVGALEPILAGLTQRGLRAVSVPALLAPA